MDEELTNLDENIIETEIYIEDIEQNIESEETTEVVEVETIEEVEITVDEAIGWVGGDSTRHYSLHGRDEPNQHPIAAITGLREELNNIEALGVVYSNKRNQANYYLWQDENVLQENRVGYFVGICPGIEKIQLCDSDNAIFGVTVDNAGFVGAQDDIIRDYKYGLVVTSGVVHVRCESDVVVGDYVISNNYGYATKSKSGYKVVGVHDIDGVEHAEIMLITPISRICDLTDEVDDLSDRMDDAETNIISAMNVANAAYNKAGEAGNISEAAIKNALEALDKADDAVEDVGKIEEVVSSANQVAVQAKAIAESAVVSAEAIRNEAVVTANNTLASVNDLIKDLEPITTWSDPETGNTGAEYFTTYVKDGVATKAEIQTVETLTEDNKSAIEKSSENFRILISSVDKYSVGEYSQSYGLTHEQAVSILKTGMIYVPTKHSDTRSHSEIFEDTEEINEFTPGNYYEWDGNDWIEYGNSVAFFSEEPIPSNTLTYWYLDSNEAPEGYEPYSLYMYDDKWVKVNIYYNNPNNRMVSSISQEVDKISLEVTNARGSYAGLDARLTDVDSQVKLASFWVNPDGEINSMANLGLKSDDGGSTMSLIVRKQNDENQDIVLDGASIILNTDGENPFISLSAKSINLEGVVTANQQFQINTDGSMIAIGGIIGGWTLDNKDGKALLYCAPTSTIYGTGMATSSVNTDPAFWAGYGGYLSGDTPWDYGKSSGNWRDYTKFYVTQGGELHSIAGQIAGFTITPDGLFSNKLNIFSNSGSGWLLEVGENGSWDDFGIINTLHIWEDAAGGYLDGYWSAENDLSDSRVKNSVEELPENYEILFDNLQSKRYKYNHGTSNRFHTGYIAQEVVEAIETAGLTTQDFAGVVLSKPNTEEERWFLRRDEFVALNTWQIQKAKTRITELENRVAELEKLINKE
jgi:hypothetical protein